MEVIQHSKIQLFADDKKLYKELVNPEMDAESLQNDLNNINTWANTWQLRLSPTKCQVLHISNLKIKSIIYIL